MAWGTQLCFLNWLVYAKLVFLSEPPSCEAGAFCLVWLSAVLGLYCLASDLCSCRQPCPAFLAKNSRQGIRAALQAWLQRHGTCLKDQSRIHVLQAMELLPPQDLPPSLVASGRSQTTFNPNAMPEKHRVQVSDDDDDDDRNECVAILNELVGENMAKAINPRRQLPKVLFEAVVGTLSDLWQLSTKC